MELKRIVGKDVRSATEKAIAEFGKDVFVISTSAVGRDVELIVAIEGRTSSTPVPEEQDKGAAQGGSPAANVDAGFEMSEASFPQVFHSIRKRPVASNRSDPIGQQLFVQKRRAGAGAAASAPVETRVEAEDVVRIVRQEIAQLRRDLLCERRSAAAYPLTQQSHEVGQVMRRLDDSGVPAELRALMTASLNGALDAEGAARVMTESLSAAIQGVQSSIPCSGYHALCGASGVGKTLIAARLLRMAARTHDLDQLALISFSDTRPGAWSQIQLLGSRLGVVSYRARDPEGLSAILAGLLPGTFAVIDTSGIDFLKTAAALSGVDPAIQLHAVIPVDVTSSALVRALGKTATQWTSVILTKMDEAACPWPLLRMMCRHPIEISGVGASERDADDLKPFKVDELIDIAMHDVFDEWPEADGLAKEWRQDKFMIHNKGHAIDGCLL